MDSDPNGTIGTMGTNNTMDPNGTSTVNNMHDIQNGMELLDTSLQSQFNTPQDRWKSSTQQIHSHDPQEQQEETPKSKFRLVGVTSLSSKTEDKPQTFTSFSQRIKTNTSSFGQHISMKSPEELSQQPSRSPNTPEEDSQPSRKYR